MWRRQMSAIFSGYNLSHTRANRSVHGLGKWFVPELRLPLFCTNQFQLQKNGREGLKLVSRMSLKQWNTNFRLSVLKNSDVSLFPEIFRRDNPKSCLPFTFQPDFPETFCKWLTTNVNDLIERSGRRLFKFRGPNGGTPSIHKKREKR